MTCWSFSPFFFLNAFANILAEISQATYGTQEVTASSLRCFHEWRQKFEVDREIREARGTAHSRGPYPQCSQEAPTPSGSAASSAQRGRSPDSDSVVDLLWGGSGRRVWVGLLPSGGDWGSSPGRPPSAVSCRDCSRLRYLPTEAPACGSSNRPALSTDRMKIHPQQFKCSSEQDRESHCFPLHALQRLKWYPDASSPLISQAPRVKPILWVKEVQGSLCCREKHSLFDLATVKWKLHVSLQPSRLGDLKSRISSPKVFKEHARLLRLRDLGNSDSTKWHFMSHE